MIQKNRRFRLEKRVVVNKKMVGLLKEVYCFLWPSNAVLLKSFNGKQRMYIDYIDLNKTCPNDPFLLLNIDKLSDNSFRYHFFMIAYLIYNQIQCLIRMRKICHLYLCCKIIPFGLKCVTPFYPEYLD
ncbi:hypothetical protein CR513_21573, partial [Mucuna pruriens]